MINNMFKVQVFKIFLLITSLLLVLFGSKFSSAIYSYKTWLLFC